jgi:hypothetical protein
VRAPVKVCVQACVGVASFREATVTSLLGSEDEVGTKASLRFPSDLAITRLLQGN